MSYNTRRSSRNKTPSSSHYVGYVEDEESIESIMKKFEAMEKYKEQVLKEKENEIKKENSPSTNTISQDKIEEKIEVKEENIVFDEKNFEDIFKITSSFAVQTTIEEDQFQNMYYEDDDYDDDPSNEDKSFNEEDFFKSEEDSEEKKEKKKLKQKWKKEESKNGSNKNVASKKNGTSKPRSKKNKSDEENGGSTHIQNVKKRLTCEVTDENGYKYTIRKKAKKKDPLKEENIRIPKDTTAWAKDIQPYNGKENKPIKGAKYLQVENITTIDWSNSENNKQEYLAILMDPPWKCSNKEGFGVDVNDLKKMTLPSSALFIFIWTEKEVIPGVVRMMEDWEYNYVENFVWVKKQVNNRFLEQEYPYFSKSKLTLLIFRKNTKHQVELRHQRNPDVSFDFVKMKEVYSNKQEKNRFSSSQTESKPLFVYHLIETLLPTGNFDEKSGYGKFLHLWSDLNYYRKGWTTVHS